MALDISKIQHALPLQEISGVENNLYKINKWCCFFIIAHPRQFAKVDSRGKKKRVGNKYPYSQMFISEAMVNFEEKNAKEQNVL